MHLDSALSCGRTEREGMDRGVVMGEPVELRVAGSAALRRRDVQVRSVETEHSTRLCRLFFR